MSTTPLMAPLPPSSLPSILTPVHNTETNNWKWQKRMFYYLSLIVKVWDSSASLLWWGPIIIFVCGTLETIGMEMRMERKIIICSRNNIVHSAHCEHVDLVDCSEFSSDEMTCMLTATGMTCCVCTATLRQMNEWKVFGWAIYLLPSLLSLLCICLEWSVFVISPLVQTEPFLSFLVMMSILPLLWIIWSPFVL